MQQLRLSEDVINDFLTLQITPNKVNISRHLQNIHKDLFNGKLLHKDYIYFTIKTNGCALKQAITLCA